MATLVARHGITNYDTWRSAYEQADSLRSKHGCTSERVLRDCADDLSVLVLHEFPTIEAAQAFANDPELGAAMQKAGVTGPPTIEFFTEG